MPATSCLHPSFSAQNFLARATLGPRPRLALGASHAFLHFQR